MHSGCVLLLADNNNFFYSYHDVYFSFYKQSKRLRVCSSLDSCAFNSFSFACDIDLLVYLYELMKFGEMKIMSEIFPSGYARVHANTVYLACHIFRAQTKFTTSYNFTKCIASLINLLFFSPLAIYLKMGTFFLVLWFSA